MTAIAIEEYNIKGFPAPRPITSETQNEHYTEVLCSLERRGHLSASEEKYAELLTGSDPCCLAHESASGIDGGEQPQAEEPRDVGRVREHRLRSLAGQKGAEQAPHRKTQPAV
jgi:hypothetical protein